MKRRPRSRDAQPGRQQRAPRAAATSHAIRITRIRPAPSRSRPAAVLGPPGAQQPVLQAEHRGMLVRVSVVVSEQVQDAVGAQHLQFVGYRVLRLAGLLGGDLRAQHHVAEQARRRALLVGAVGAVAAGRRRPQLVHGKGQHVGRARLTQPALVQVGHGAPVHQQNGQLRQRVYPHLVEHVPGQRGQAGLVHVTPDSLAISMLTAGPVAGPACTGRRVAGAAPGAGAPGPRAARGRAAVPAPLPGTVRPPDAPVRVVGARRR